MSENYGVFALVLKAVAETSRRLDETVLGMVGDAVNLFIIKLARLSRLNIFRI